MIRAWFDKVRNYVGQFLHRAAQRVSVDPVGGPTASVTVSVVTPHLKADDISVSRDAPYAGDLLEREPFGDALNGLVDYGGGSGVVLIDARWGNGKTTFLRMWVQKARNDRKIVASLNAWEGTIETIPSNILPSGLRANSTVSFRAPSFVDAGIASGRSCGFCGTPFGEC